jgi:hypothetical protein
MEPRPPKSTRPAPGLPSPVASPPPVPTAERLAARPAWIDAGSAGGASNSQSHFGVGRDEQGPIDPALASAITPSQVRGAPWNDPTDDPALGLDQGVVGGLRSPLSPVVSPRGERRSRFIGPILAALLLVLVVGGAAFAVDKARDGNDSRSAADATSTARSVAGVASPPATETTAAGDDVAPTPTGETGETAGNTSAVSNEPDDGEAGASPTEAAATNAEEGNASDAEPTATKRAATKEPTARSSGGTVRAADVLPSVNDLPDGFEMTREGELKKADVVAALGEGSEALLTEWKWRENAFREFTIEGADPETTFFLSVSVHRTGGREGAEKLLDSLADVLASIPGYEEADVEKIGDQTRALTNTSEGANLYALYVRQGSLVFRLGGSSATGDPSDDVIALAKQLVGE